MLLDYCHVNNDVIIKFRKKLKNLRIRFGCTSKQLSELIGCDASYISKIENGRITPPLDKLVVIADYFGIKFEELFK